MTQERSQGRRHPARPPGDHDIPYVFGRLPTSDRPFPFALMEYARLLFLRGRMQDGAFPDDRDGRFSVTQHQGVVWVERDGDPYV